MSRPIIGIYCLTPATGISPANRPTAVTVDWTSTMSPEGNATAMSTPPSGNCSSSEQFTVVTQRRGAMTSAVPADDIGFTIIVP